MKNFTYFRPNTVDQAVALLDAKWGPVELLAGGTDLLDLQKEYVAQPERVVSLTGIAGLAGIRNNGGNVTIGAGTTLAVIAENAELRKLFPALTTAAGDVGGPQIRNMGTLGGNLCQRNRCWYFRDEATHCLLKGGDKCFALLPGAENRYHAVFSQGHKCVIVHPSTLAPALIALKAEAEVQGLKGKRKIALSKFFQAPSSANEREHVLAPTEVVTQVIIPINEETKNASYEVRHKQAYDWPLVQAAAAFEISELKVANPRIVLGHVAPTPLASEAAAEAIAGKEVTEENAAEAGKAAAKGAKALSQNAYKLKLIEVAVKRALLTAAGKEKYWEA
jgi:xanthine dehydrogenase YagS FAD-binding subunit